jgi:hypothetical protein
MLTLGALTSVAPVLAGGGESAGALAAAGGTDRVGAGENGE